MKELAAQAHKFHPAAVVIADETLYEELQDLLRHESRCAVLADKSDGYDVFARMEHTLWNVVYARGVLVIRHSHLDAVDPHLVGIYKGAKAERGLQRGLAARDLNGLTEPVRPVERAEPETGS